MNNLGRDLVAKHLAKGVTEGAASEPGTRTPHALRDVVLFFLRLGFTAFGGPAAHIAMMEEEVVRRRGWLGREQFLDLLGATNWTVSEYWATQLGGHLATLDTANEQNWVFDNFASYGGRQTTPGLTFGGTDENYLTANQYSIETGRNFTPDDVELGRPVVIIGQDEVKKLFPSESPLQKMIKIKGRTYVVIGTFATKGQAFGNYLPCIMGPMVVSKASGTRGAGQSQRSMRSRPSEAIKVATRSSAPPSRQRNSCQ